MRTLQFTIPAGGPTPNVIQLNYPGNFNNIVDYYQQITIQNNNTGNIRIGDSSVSATVGLLLSPTSSITLSTGLSHRGIQEIFVYGTAGYVIDVMLLE